MDQMKYKNTTKWLFVFWLLSVVVGGILSRVYMNTPPLEIRPQILDPFSWFGIMITVYVLFVSFPLLYVIQRRAKLAGMKAVGDRAYLSGTSLLMDRRLHFKY